MNDILLQNVESGIIKLTENSSRTHHQVSYDHDQHKDQNAKRLSSHLHTIPHGLDPLPAQDPEHDEERVEEVLHVPAREGAVVADLAHAVLIVLSKQLHAHHSEDEDDDGQDQRQVPQGAHRVTDDLYQRVEGGPWLC